jgi:hypothetical protein
VILRFKEARKGRSGGKRVVVTETVEDALLHGRIDKRSGAFYVESGHLMVEFPAHEAAVVWELLTRAFEGKLLRVSVGRPRHRKSRGAASRAAHDVGVSVRSGAKR